jgi:aryl-alcohol dehydrogenase-like predicted oxidoreductase
MTKGTPVISLAYNLYHRGELDSYMYDLVEQKTGVFVHSVLSHGLLAGTWPGNKEFSPDDHRAERWTRDTLKHRMRQLSTLKPVLGESASTFRALALRFALSNAAVTSVVLGARNAIQLDQLVRESGRAPPYLDPNQLVKLRECLNAAGVW